MRTNLVYNGGFEVDVSGWITLNATGQTRVAGPSVSGWLGRVTCNGTGTAPVIGSVAKVPISGLVPHTASAKVRASVGNTGHLRMAFWDSSGALQGFADTPTVAFPAGLTQWQVTATPTAGAVSVSVQLVMDGVPASGVTFDLGDVLVEAASAVGSWFSAYSVNCGWAGTVGGSPALRYSLDSTLHRVNTCPNPSAGVDLTGWSMGGTGGPLTRVAQDSGWAVSVVPSSTVTYISSPATTTPAGGYWVGGIVLTGPAGRNVDVRVHDGTGYLTASFVVAMTGGRLVVRTRSLTAASGAAPAPRIFVYPQAGWAAGEVLTLTTATIEQVAGAGLLPPGGPFDGETLNGVWAGTRYASVSSVVNVATRSNFPVLEVEAWPGVNPTLTGVPSTPGRFLTDRSREFKIGRGRQYELAQDEAASGSLKVNNSDGSLTGGANGCTPITSCRVRATWGGVTYPVWTGLVRSWPREDENPSVAWSEVELTDAFEPLANREFGTVIEEEIRHMAVPDAWYPMNEPESSTSIGSLTPGGPPAPLVSLKVGGIPLTLGTESVFAGTSETVLSLANATGTTGRASQWQIVGPQNPGSGYSMPFGQPWGVGVFVRMTAGASMVWSALDKDGTVMAGVEVNAGTQTITGYQRMGGPGASYVTMPCATGAMLLGCYLHFGHDGTNAFLYVYGVTSNGSLYAVQASGAEPITTGTSTWVAWGPSFRSDTIWYSSNADFQMCHGTIWTTSPPAPYTNPVIAIATAGLNSFLGYKGRDQAAFLAAWAGASVTGDPTDGATLGQVRDTNGSSALDAIRAVAVDQLSRVFMSTSGQLAWLSVHHAMGAPAEWVFGGAAGELPYTGSPGFDFDPTYVYNDVQVQRPDNRGVAQQTSATKALARATDAASGLSYFQRVLQVDSNVQADADAAALASYLLHEYAQPKTRVRTVSFDPSANPALWPFVLGAELGDTVTLNHRALGRPNLSLSLSIQSINHSVDAQSGSWVTDMELAPWSSDWVLAAMHTTVAASTIVGATTITLAPLSDAAYNPAEASLGVGTQIWLSPFTANAETVTVASVVSQPTAGATGYTSIAVTLTAAAAKAHTVGDLVCDPLPSGVGSPTTWDAFSVLDSTTVVSL